MLNWLYLWRRQILRKKETFAEALLWRYLRNRQVENAKFRRQHNIGPFIADFYCSEDRLVIEVDGPPHYTPEKKIYDANRTAYINDQNIEVIRFSNGDVLGGLESVLEEIRHVLRRKRAERSARVLPTQSGGG